MRGGSVCFNSCNSVLYGNNCSLHEYKWCISSPQQLSLYRKLSDIIYDVEHTLTKNKHDDLSLQDVIDVIRCGSANVRKHVSEYIGFLFTEKHKLEEQLTQQHIDAHNMTQSEFESMSSSCADLKDEIELLINSEYVWNLAEIFWMDATESNDSILITLKFLDVMTKFRSNDCADGFGDEIEFNSDAYWNILYKNAIYGKLHIVLNEINNFANNEISVFNKKLIQDLCIECPLFRCLRGDHDDDEDMLIPTKHDIVEWKKSAKRVMHQITDKSSRLLPLLQIFCGEMNVISSYIDDNNWIDWICAYLLYNTAWIDHANELASILTKKTAFSSSSRGSIEWMFGCIMSNEYNSILLYVDVIFPQWFAPHLCYFLRRLHPDLAISWPRHHDIATNYNDNYDLYIYSHPKMTMIEWIFSDYVCGLLSTNSDCWIWLKNYLYFFKRRGLTILNQVFASIHIESDKMCYLMLQTVDELNLNSNSEQTQSDIYNSICLRMAHKSYLNNCEYGRIAYWCSKCSPQTQTSCATFNMYLAHLITNYLSHPTQYINVLHDVCDNACDSNDIVNLHLLFKLRNMYLCRYDLQKVDIENIKKNTKNNKKKAKKTPKPSPFTTSRGHLIDALSKPYSNENKNLKNIADSFDIKADDDDDDDEDAFDVDDDDDDIKYPSLKQGPFPKAVLRRNKGIKEKESSDFLLNNLLTPPRPKSGRIKKNSHRKSSHKKNKMSGDDTLDDLDDEYMMECCDIIVSFVGYLQQILSTQMYSLAHAIPILIFSLPILSHKYAPNAITMNQILIITHKWYDIKFQKNEEKTQIRKYNKEKELKYINQILAHLQAKVLATTYSNKNYAQMWKMKENENNNMNVDVEPDEAHNCNDDDDDDDDDDIIDID